MAAGNTYVALATNTLSSATASVTFSSISGAYTDLVLVMNGTLSSGSALNYYLRFNGDTGTNYSYTYLLGDGSAASSGRASTIATPLINYVNSTAQQTTIVHIMNYANTTTYKTSLARGSDSTLAAILTAVLWRNTSAITSITLTLSANNFATGHTFTLYGIAAA